MNDVSMNPPPSGGVSITTLILTAALTVATTAAVVLAVLHFTSGDRPSGSGPFVQKDAVKPQGHASGDVVYMLPYAAPPHLTLTSPHRPYTDRQADRKGLQLGR